MNVPDPKEKIKKNVWYPLNQPPPKRTERLGSSVLVLWLGDKVQPGFYSHEENTFYVICHKFRPATGNKTEITMDVQTINEAMSWEQIPAPEAEAWMLVKRFMR